jgi:hypothetical protein
MIEMCLEKRRSIIAQLLRFVKEMAVYMPSNAPEPACTTTVMLMTTLIRHLSPHILLSNQYTLEEETNKLLHSLAEKHVRTGIDPVYVTSAGKLYICSFIPGY